MKTKSVFRAYMRAAILEGFYLKLILRQMKNCRTAVLIIEPYMEEHLSYVLEELQKQKFHCIYSPESHLLLVDQL